MTPPSPRLFGRPLARKSSLTLADQAFDILRIEIATGRWQIGDRLPGVATLARASGLSRAPLAHALQRLCREGYLRQEPRAGTFLKSVTPDGHAPLGAIGVLLPRPRGNPLTGSLGDQWRLHKVLEAAGARHFVTEVQCLDNTEMEQMLNAGHSPFRSQVRGIISLCSFAHHWRNEPPDNRLPLVFLGDLADLPAPPCSPCVLPDPRHGFHQLTRHLLDRGHRATVLFASPPAEQEAALHRLAWEGHTAAMREAGLSPNETAFRQSIHTDPFQKDALDTFFRSHPATAVICTDGVAPGIVAWARARDIRIPQDISIAGHAGAPIDPSDPAHRIAAIDYDLESMVDACFDCLARQERDGIPHWSALHVWPRIKEGHSIAPPRTGKLPI